MDGEQSWQLPPQEQPTDMGHLFGQPEGDRSKEQKQEPTDDNAGRNVLRYGKGDKAGYATWSQATDAQKLFTEELRRNIHTSLQLPDMSMEQMKATPMSGEARKMLFIDCQMKVTDESGDWLEFFDREVNVVRAFCKDHVPRAGAGIRHIDRHQRDYSLPNR